MSLYIVDIHGELEGDYEIIKKYEEPTKNDLEVDCIDRNSIKYYPGTGGYMYASKGEIDQLPPVTPQEPTDKSFTKADIDAIVKAINAHWELIIDEIKSEIENYKLSEDELTEMDEDSIKWGMKIAYDIIETLENFANEFRINDLIARINTDDYYYDRSDMVKAAGSFAEFAKHYDLDVPEALELELMKEHIRALLNGDEVYLPEYDMSGTAIRHDNVKLATPSKIIISEGLFTLTPKVVDAFDFKVYVHVSSDVQKERFYRRAAERGLGSSMDEVYENASSKAKIYIHPTMESADIILSGEADRMAYKVFVNKVLNMVKEIHFNRVLMYS
jgi:uridine kinase